MPPKKAAVAKGKAKAGKGGAKAKKGPGASSAQQDGPAVGRTSSYNSEASETTVESSCESIGGHSTSSLRQDLEDLQDSSIDSSHSAVDNTMMPVRSTSRSSTRGRRMSRSQSKSKLNSYNGPRPDENLLDAVASEIHAQDAASIEWIYELIESGEDVDQRSLLGVSPLALAALAGNGGLVSILLEKGADVKLLSLHKSELALHQAVRSNSRVVCELIAAPTAAAGMIDWPNSTGWPALHIAAVTGNQAALRILLRHGADINSRNAILGGHTPLHRAVQSGDVDVVEFLIDRDAKVDVADGGGSSPLHFAAVRGERRVVSLLLRSKADPMREGSTGLKPIDMIPDPSQNETMINLLEAYMRPPPDEWRRDARFDRKDIRDVMPDM